MCLGVYKIIQLSFKTGNCVKTTRRKVDVTLSIQNDMSYIMNLVNEGYNSYEAKIKC